MTSKPHHDASNTPPEIRQARIMMIDDDTLMTETVNEYLADRGCAPLVAMNDPSGALERIRSEKPDLLLLDLLMPELSGYDILQEIKADAELKSLPVIVLTAAADVAHRMKALQLGASAVIAKPIDDALLFRHLQQHLVPVEVKRDNSAPSKDA